MAMTRPVIPLMEYVIYEDYIAEFLCINKDNEALECNGKCYLMQKIQEQNEEKQENLPKIAMEEYPIGFIHFLALSSSGLNESAHQPQFHYLDSYHYLLSLKSFHPPSISC